MDKIISKSLEVAGRTLTFEIGRYASRATSAVLARYGETTVLATVVVSPQESKLDYFPLTVEYQVRLYAGGRIKGSRWVKREGRPTDAEVLSGRLIDRSIRPLFPKSFHHEVQAIITVLSVDLANDPDILAINAASTALAISPIPWNGPVAAVRMGLVESEIVVNPPGDNEKPSDLDLVVTSNDHLVTMLEAGASQVPEERVFKALETGHGENQKIIKLIAGFAEEVGQTKISVPVKPHDASLVKQVSTSAKEIIKDTLDSAKGKSVVERMQIYEDAKETVVEGFDENVRGEVKVIIDELFTQSFRSSVLEKNKRWDGRKLEEVRPLGIEVGILPRVHGSAHFQRGDTEALTVTTLGAPSLSQSLETAEGDETKRYMHHYNFPPFSVGETGRMGLSRREIGHGALAERALIPVIPPETEFPYAVRVVSEIMTSNGSTSMAAACGSTLSLMDAGVPILAPVSGISTGLITPKGYPGKTDGYVLLTDINGGEDQYGDMDFKVAGTEKGVTAIQLDVKVPGLTLEICKETFTRARAARMEILKAMLAVLPKSRPQLSQYAPKISTIQMPIDKIGELIGPGGKVIRKLMADTETSIDVNDDGTVFVSGSDQEKVNQVLTWIQSLSHVVAPGEIYEGTVARIQPFGVFVEILPGKDGMVHVSLMANDFVSDPNQIVKVGDKVKVWVTEIDDLGRINLSMLFDQNGQPLAKARPPRPERPSFGGPRMGGGFDRNRPPRRPGGFRR
jgi:polyribonucleotide nucleotidyltransferase